MDAEKFSFFNAKEHKMQNKRTCTQKDKRHKIYRDFFAEIFFNRNYHLLLLLDASEIDPLLTTGNEKITKLRWKKLHSQRLTDHFVLTIRLFCLPFPYRKEKRSFFIKFSNVVGTQRASKRFELQTLKFT